MTPALAAHLERLSWWWNYPPVLKAGESHLYSEDPQWPGKCWCGRARTGRFCIPLKAVRP